MDRLCELIVLALGRLTFALLHYFESLGVDMSEVDLAIAEWSDAYAELQAHNTDLQAQLEAAGQTLTEWEALDAVEDAEQKAALEAQIAEQIRAALETAKNPPTPPGEEVPPAVPDQTLPGEQPEPDQTLPGGEPHPDQTLPGDLPPQ